MKHYRSIDLLITAAQQHAAGRFEKAASLFDRAVTSKDFTQALSYLERRQQAAYAQSQTKVVAKPTEVKPVAKKVAPETAGQRLAAFLIEVAAKKVAKTKKTAKGKGLPFGGKMAPPFKKKAKASPDAEIFEETMDSMSEEEAGLGDDLDGLTVQDVDGSDLDTDMDGVEELPLAGADDGQGESDLDTDMDDASDLPDDMDDLEMYDMTADSNSRNTDKADELKYLHSTEADADDSEEDDEDPENDPEDEDDDEEEDAATIARVSLVASNLKALDRLAATSSALRLGKDSSSSRDKTVKK